MRSGVAVAEPDHAHSVHVDVDGLEPATDYYYRFTVGEHTSPVGADEDAARRARRTRFGLAVVNCQWYETGSLRRLPAPARRGRRPRRCTSATTSTSSPASDGRAHDPARSTRLETLADYRLRYASYALDEDLRNAHHRFPFVLTWDDHEVANNYSGDVLVEQPDAPEAAQERKTAAYQAWWEHLPVRVGPPDGGELVVNQFRRRR